MLENRTEAFQSFIFLLMLVTHEQVYKNFLKGLKQ